MEEYKEWLKKQQNENAFLNPQIYACEKECEGKTENEQSLIVEKYTGMKCYKRYGEFTPTIELLNKLGRL